MASGRTFAGARRGYPFPKVQRVEVEVYIMFVELKLDSSQRNALTSP